MSSIRVENMAVSDEKLETLDKFMFSLGFEFYPGYDNKAEPANMPWSTRWYRPDTIQLSSGETSTLYQTVDVSMFWYENTIKKDQRQKNG